MKKRWSLAPLLAIALPEVVGLLSGLLAGDIGGSYRAIARPPLSPPGWVFPVAWILLYACMGIASYLIYRERPRARRRAALAFYVAQLAVNFAWSPIFFGLRAYGVALAVIALLVGLVAITLLRFLFLRRAAGYLLIPICSGCFSRAI